MRIAVTGKAGQIVSALLERGAIQNVEIIPVGRPELDLADPMSVQTTLFSVAADVIVSVAAYTAVDNAEREPALAFTLNAEGPRAVAQAAQALGVPVVHISTDYVFSGERHGAYIETDATGPISVYGRSKLDGEENVALANPNHAILRTAWVYSPFGTNFLKKMLELAQTHDSVNVVCDQQGAPTSALDIADAVIVIAKRLVSDPNMDLRGIFHLTASGEASWADFAEVIFAEVKASVGKSITVHRITTADYPTLAKRPANSRLSNNKLRQFYGIVLPDWKRSAKVVLDRLLRYDADTAIGFLKH